MTEAVWEPGEPLYRREDHANSLYLFNFRDDTEAEDCCCADSADWPAQRRRPLPNPDDGDEIGRLIAEVRADAEHRSKNEEP